MCRKRYFVQFRFYFLSTFNKRRDRHGAASQKSVGIIRIRIANEEAWGNGDQGGKFPEQHQGGTQKGTRPFIK